MVWRVDDKQEIYLDVSTANKYSKSNRTIRFKFIHRHRSNKMLVL